MFTTMIRNHMKTDIHAMEDVRGKTDLDSKEPSELIYLASKKFNH